MWPTPEHLLRVFTGWPFSGPCTPAIGGRLRRSDPSIGGGVPAGAHLFPCCPMQSRRRISASEDSATRAVLLRRRTTGRAELPSLAPVFRASRSPVLYGHFRRARCNNGVVPCASRYHPEKVSSFRVAGECDLRLSWRVLLHGVFYSCKPKVEFPHVPDLWSARILHVT